MASMLNIEPMGLTHSHLAGTHLTRTGPNS
jgi:hypothetical protein